MKKRNEQSYNDPWDRDFYETGSTRPPKNRGGIIAVLLILVIILGGITTGLGLMNIKLFHMLENLQQEPTGEDIIQLDPSVQGDATTPTWAQTQSPEEESVRLGLECVTVSAFDRRFYRLPDGCLVMGVDEDGCAGKAGVVTGDVIVSLDGKAVDGVEDLIVLLETYRTGDTVDLTVYRSRSDKKVTIEVTLD